MGKSASKWSSKTKTRFPLKILFTVAAILVLSSPAYILQAAAAAPTLYTVDPAQNVGSYVSLDLDSQGRPGISYYDFNNTNLKYAHWTGSRWNVQTVDDQGFTGLHTSIAYDSKDSPHITYFADNALKYAYWNGAAWSTQSVDAAGSFTSIAIDANDHPHISYFSVQNGADLKYAAWTGTSWKIETVDSEGVTGEFTSLKLDGDGYAHISYYDWSTRHLKIAWQDNTGWHIQTVDSATDVGEFSSLDLDADGNTHIAYCDNATRDLKYAYYNGQTWSIQTLDSAGDVGTDCSLALDSAGYPHISYTDNTNHVLKYAAWNGTRWNIQTLRYAGYVGEYTSLPNDQTSIKIDQNGTACIAYCDWANYCLKYITAPAETETVTRIVQPTATVTVGPNPIGIWQPLYIRMTIAPNPPQISDQFSGVILNITNPDGTTMYLGPFLSEPNGLLYASFTPTQIGKYIIQMNYTGQFFPSANATYLEALSEKVELTVQQEPVSPKTWTVSNGTRPADFTSIQAAVNAAGIGDIVYVYSGVYKEPQITINKPLTLLGENKCSTILDGNPGAVRLYVSSTIDVKVSGFAIVNGYGLYSAYTKNVQITDNIIYNSSQGVILGPYAAENTVANNVFTNNSLALLVTEGSHDNTITRNIVTGSKQDAICISNSNSNRVTENYVASNGVGTMFGYKVYGIRLTYSNSNVVYHNDLIGNFLQADNWNSNNNLWDNGYPSGGNYWSDYTGADANGDGIGDTAYVVSNNAKDRYPLMALYTHVNASNIPSVIYPTTPTPTITPTPTPTPTTTTSSTSTTSNSNSQAAYVEANQQTNDYNQWQDNPQPEDTNQYEDEQDPADAWRSGFQNPGPFPVVESLTAAVVAFSICVGVILFLKRWE